MALGRQSDLAPLLFSCIATLVPCVMSSWWQIAPLLVIWALGAGVRLLYGDRQLNTDAIVFGIATTLFARRELRVVLSTVAEELGKVAGSWRHDGRFLFPSILAFLLFLWAIYPRPRTPRDLPRGLTKWTSQYPRPKIFPCSTKHARMFPKRHSFEYSYLQCGFPIIPAGITPEGEAVGGLHDREVGRWWLRIRAEDYLNRGNGDLGFYGKLKLFLRHQHVRDHEWDYAYLVTAPRFFGYAFNPVSFWYIYDTDQQLTKMILEVNNTFGERRMYLLDGSSMPSPPSTPESEASGPPLPEGVKARFTDLWMKDFHVSPFNSRKGSYALKALNPFPYATYDKPAIDNTITLKSSKDHAKLVARISSTGKALDPEEMGTWASLKFVFNWWWVGLVTMPRILREAFKIFFKRKLHVWFRPEVLYTSVGRSPTSTEIELYHIFKDYLAYLVNQSQEPFCITLHSAIPDEPVQKIETDHRPGEQSVTRDFEIHILTPAFYSRFVHYAYTSEAFDRECIFTDEKNRTLWISRPELLAALMSRLRFSERCLEDTVERSYLDKVRWNILRKLRCPAAAPAYPISAPSKQDLITEDVRALPLSELDYFVRNVAGQAHAGSYRRILTKIFLAQRLCLGFAEVIGLLDSVFRVLLCSLGAWQFRSWSMREPDVNPLRCLRNNLQSSQLGSCFTGDAVRAEWLWLIGTTLCVSAYHVYGMMKGYN